MQLTVTHLGKARLFLLLPVATWQAPRSESMKSFTRMEDMSDKSGGEADAGYCFGGPGWPRNLPENRARKPARENLPDCWMARTWSFPSCLRYR